MQVSLHHGTSITFCITQTRHRNGKNKYLDEISIQLTCGSCGQNKISYFTFLHQCVYIMQFLFRPQDSLLNHVVKIRFLTLLSYINVHVLCSFYLDYENHRSDYKFYH